MCWELSGGSGRGPYHGLLDVVRVVTKVNGISKPAKVSVHLVLGSTLVCTHDTTPQSTPQHSAAAKRTHKACCHSCNIEPMLSDASTHDSMTRAHHIMRCL